MKTFVYAAAAAAVALSLAALPSCNKHDHDHAGDHDHDHDHDHGTDTKGGDGHSHGAAKPLGEQTAGGFTVAATQEGAVAAGSEASLRVKVTGGAAKVTAVRFWIGAADGKGALKAKADLDGDAWHAHAEAPASLDGARLHVEIESEGGVKAAASFDLAK